MIDTDLPDGKAFRTLATALHARRIGVGLNRWDWGQAKPIEGDRLAGVQVLDSYLRNDPPLATRHQSYGDEVREFLRKGRLNLADAVVSSTSARMQVRDFRTAAANDELGDAVAREHMLRQELAVKFADVHEWMLAHGESYAIIAPRVDGPVVSAESALEVIADVDPATGQVRKALKMFRDPWDSADFVYLYLPGVVRVAVKRRGGSSINGAPWRMSSGWEWDDSKTVDFTDAFGPVVPVVPYRNRHGLGDYETHLPTIDRINDKIASEWWIFKRQAFRQRALRKVPSHDEAGNPIELSGEDFPDSPDALWLMPGDSEVWESSPTDVNPMISSVQKDLERFCATTFTPLHTLVPDTAGGSAEGAALKREEHVYKVEDRRDLRAAPGHRRTMSLIFKFSGDDARADVAQIQPIWNPVERFSLQERAQAASQAVTSLPRERILTDIWQYPPAEVPDMTRQLAANLLFQPPNGAAGGR